jgi:beta-glucosidase
MTQHGYLNTDVAKKEWGWSGVMMSDWTSTYDAVGAANGGLDLEMPSGVWFNREKLLPAIKEGKVSPAAIDDKVRRLLRMGVRFGWLDRDQTDASIPRYNPKGAEVALESAREAVVLLKNDGGILPLDKTKVKTIAVIGPNAYPAVPVAGGSGRVQPFAAVSLLEGVSRVFGKTATVTYGRGLPTWTEMAEGTVFWTTPEAKERGLKGEYFAGKELKGTPLVTRTDRHVRFGAGAWMSFPDKTESDRWSGYYVPKSAGAHTVFVAGTGEDGGQHRLWIDDRLVLDNWDQNIAIMPHATLSLEARPYKVVLEHRGRSYWLGGRFGLGIVRHGEIVDAGDKALAARADVVVLAVGFDFESESEAADRTFRLPPGQDELIQEIAGANKNTIVVMSSGGGVDTNLWLGRVPALVQAWYPGQEGGTALAEILSGDVNPSGRLAATFEQRWEDNPAHDTYHPPAGTQKVEYREGVFVGYRGYQKKNVKPLFPFGFGLSYTTFKYDNLKVAPAASGRRTYDVTFDVTNTGTRAGADVAQVYVAHPSAKVPRPPRELKGFSKVSLKPGETKSVTVTLDERAFSYYDAKAKRWTAERGPYEILVGRSSEELPLKAPLTLAAK